MSYIGRWIRQQYGHLCEYREARRQERVRRFVEMANRPENVERLRRENETRYGRLVLDEDGFHLLKGGRCEVGVRWADVRTIRAYKRDFFAYDMICLAFEVRDGKWVQAWESMVDFPLVREKVHELYPNVPKDWFHEVMHPAFEPNDRILWKQDQRRSRGEDGGDPLGDA